MLNSVDIKRIAIEVVKLMKQERLIETKPERLLTLKETAEMFRLSPKAFYNKKERLPYVKENGRILYRESDVLKALTR